MKDSRRLKKHALLIAIDDYPNLPPQCRLQGSINDQKLMEKVLRERYGFTEPAKLTNDTATREGILDAFTALQDKVEKNDVVVVHYSGHGSIFRDPSGESQDGYYETIVPYDSGRGEHENRDIVDREINERLVRLIQKTPYVTWIMDCCHSGSVLRNSRGENVRGIDPDDDASQIRRIHESRLYLNQSNEHNVLFSACGSRERAHEIQDEESGEFYGCLSYYLYRELVETSSEGTYRDVLERIAPEVSAAFPKQGPKIEGARDREVFGTSSFVPMRHVLVDAREQNEVLLRGGRVHALIPKSEWTIYAPGTKREEVCSYLGRIRLTQEIDGKKARGVILEETEADAIGVSCRAVEVLLDDSDEIWKVRLGEFPDLRRTEMELLAERIAESRYLKLAKPGESEDVLIEPSRGGGQSETLDFRQRDLAWSVTIGGDSPTGFRSSEAIDGPTELVDDLEQHHWYRRLLSIRSDDDEWAAAVETELMKTASDGGWEAASGGLRMPIYQEGDRLGIRITNRLKSRIYIGVVDFGLTGGINVVYPVHSDDKPLAPGRSLRLGMRSEEKLTVVIPDGYLHDEGIECVKIYISKRPLHLEILHQQELRDADFMQVWSTRALRFLVRRSKS